jgi:hypothetical protein
MEGVLLLCDYAEEVGGKLYIMGGGWTRLTRVRQVVDLSVAAKLLVPWNEANRPHTLGLKLMTDDGAAAMDSDGRDIAISGKMEVGRPPGLTEGTPLDLPLSFRFEDLPLNEGRYRWELLVDEAVIASVSFDVLVPSFTPQ